MAINPGLMSVDYASLGRAGRAIGQGVAGYRMKQTQDLAGRALMGQTEAMTELSQRDPAMASQVKQQLQAQADQHNQNRMQMLQQRAEETAAAFTTFGQAPDFETFKRGLEGAISAGSFPALARAMQEEGEGIDEEDFEAAKMFARQAGAAAKIGTYNPRDYTPESFAEFNKTGDPSVLKRYERPVLKPIGGVMHRWDDESQTWVQTGPQAEDIGQSEGEIEGRRELVAESQKQGREILPKINTAADRVAMYDRAIELISKEGANVGALDEWLPTFKSATAELENIRNQLGLSVLQSATFGSLSEKELETVQRTALPTNMQPDQLVEWLKTRKRAEQKLMAGLAEQADALISGRKTLADIAAEANQRLNAEPQGETDIDAELEALRAEVYGGGAP